MRKRKLILGGLFLVLTACDRSSQEPGISRTNAQKEASKLSIKCQGNNCVPEAGLVLGKIGSNVWTCTGYVSDQRGKSVLLVDQTCVQPILSSGGGCKNKLALRLPSAAGTFACESLRPAGTKLYQAVFTKSLPTRPMPIAMAVASLGGEMGKIEYQLKGQVATQIRVSSVADKLALAGPQDPYGAMANLERQIQTFMDRPDDLFEWQGVTTSIDGQMTTTMIPSCLKSEALGEFKEWTWRGRQPMKSVLHQATVPAWQLSIQTEADGLKLYQLSNTKQLSIWVLLLPQPLIENGVSPMTIYQRNAEAPWFKGTLKVCP
ncbi:MAG: hypothetical protein AB7N80_09720 [Bdellovibrionales bacterium]